MYKCGLYLTHPKVVGLFVDAKRVLSLLSVGAVPHPQADKPHNHEKDKATCQSHKGKDQPGGFKNKIDRINWQKWPLFVPVCLPRAQLRS